MTDRFTSFTVILDQNIRDDDAQPIIDAIKQIRHVQDVFPKVANTSDAIAESGVRREIGEKLIKIIYQDQL